METLISYLLLSFLPIALILLVFYLNSKEKRKKGELKQRVVVIAIQFSIVILIAISYAIFLTNYEVFMTASSTVVEISLIGLSQLFLVSSSIIFPFTLKSPKLFEFIMECPSKSESRMGNINIGSIIDKTKVKHKYNRFVFGEFDFFFGVSYFRIIKLY